MKVVVSSGGVFHAYHTARAAAMMGVLQQFIIGIYVEGEEGIPSSAYKRIVLPNYLGAAIQYIPHPNSTYVSYAIRDNMFDWLAARALWPCDVFHGWTHMSLYSMRRAKSLGAKVIVDRAGVHPILQEQLLSEEYERFGLRWPKSASRLNWKQIQEFEEADGTMVCSEFIARSLRDQGIPREKVLLAPLGFDPKRFSPGLKSDNLFRVMFAGLISLQKGVPYLLEAFKRLKLPNAELVLVGWVGNDAGAFLPQYEGVYRHINWIPQAQLPALYRQASVFVIPSIQEGFGMVVPEAAGCGLPVIISENVGATIRDGQDGYVVPIRDVDALADRLLRLYEDADLRQQMGASAREYVLQHYTWDRYHERVLAHYQTLLERE
jgi:glycosyltransferase involved in cell wall biosynthesis